MSLLSGLSSAKDIVEDKDSLGGGNYQVDSGVYDAVITYAYVDQNANGTLIFNLGTKLDNGTELKQKIALTKRPTNGQTIGDTFYTNKSGEKHAMSGFIVGEAIALFGAQKQLSELSTKEAVVKVYNKEQKKEVATPVQMIEVLIGKPLKLGIKKVIKPSGSYNAQGAWIEDNTKSFSFNEIDKVFHPKSGMTVPELRAKKTEPVFLEQWKAKWDGKVDDQRSDGGAGESAASGSTPSVTPTSSLFK